MPTSPSDIISPQKMVVEVPFARWRTPITEGLPDIIFQVTAPTWEVIDLKDLDERATEPKFLLSPFNAQVLEGGSQMASTTIFQLNGPFLAQEVNVITLAEDTELSKPSLPSPQVAQYLGLLPDDNADAAIRYQSLVKEAITAIGSGHYSKIVCSHRIDYRIGPKAPSDKQNDQEVDRHSMPLADWDLVWQQVFLKLERLYPSAFVSMVWHPDFGRWITATPEVLLRQTTEGITHHFTTVSLAGTRPASIPPADPWGTKELGEQAHVTDFIKHRLADLHDAKGRPANIEVNIDGPFSHQAGPVSHLQTVLTWSVPKDSPVKVGQILTALHPTSATSGSPKEEALEFLSRNEGYNRELYAGYLGPSDGQQLRTYVNLRTMKVNQDTVSLYVGAGITIGSDPASEWAETLNKALTLLRPLVQTLSANGLELKLI